MLTLNKTGLAVCLLFTIAACQQQADTPNTPTTNRQTTTAESNLPPGPMVEYISPDSHFESEAYSQVAITQNSGKTYYLSGQIPIDAEYNLLAEDDLRGQAKAVLNNLDMALTAAGITKDDVVKINVNIVSQDGRDSFLIAEELVSYFEREDMPASTMFSVPFIVVEGVLLQIDAIAVTD